MSKSSKIILGIVVIVLIIWGISAAKKSSEPATSTEPIKIGVLGFLTGPVAAIGEIELKAAAIAVKEVNDAGGINGRPVELIVEDTAYDTKMTLSAYQALKLKGARIYLADGSPGAAAVRPLVVDDGNLVMVAGATTPLYFDGNNRTCRLALTAKNLGPALSDLLNSKGYKKVATLLPDNEYGRGMADEFGKAFLAKNGAIVIAEFYSAAAGAGDYRTNLTKIKAKQSGIDAVVMIQVANTIEPMLKQVKEIGITEPIVSDYYTANNPALKDISLANGIAFVDYEYSRTASANEAQVAKDFKAKYKNLHGSDPVFLAAAYYDEIQILAKAMKEVGDDPVKLGQYISGLKDYQGVTGKISFNSDCEVDRGVMFRMIENGMIVDAK